MNDSKTSAKTIDEVAALPPEEILRILLDGHFTIGLNAPFSKDGQDFAANQNVRASISRVLYERLKQRFAPRPNPSTRFICRPVLVEVIKFTGKNQPEIFEWMTGSPDGASQTIDNFHVLTPFGLRVVHRDYWIVKDDEGRFYVYGPAEFSAKFEPLRET